MRRVLILFATLAALSARPAPAVILATGDGTGNTAAPADDPGWLHVGSQAGTSAVYLGQGWVLTANHVANTNPTFQGVTFPVVAGSIVQLTGPDGTPADLKVYRLAAFPALSDLEIPSSAPAVGTEVILIGRGRDRGDATSWNGFSGWFYASSQTMRWGTNRVLASNLTVLGTRAFATDFSAFGKTSSEAQAATGDSGGAVFAKFGGRWMLAGILFAVGPYEEQPSNLALYGNTTYAVQLSEHKATLDALVASSVCADGLDNDGDGRIDFPADPGCFDSASMIENPACDDGIDNDADGLVDLQDGVCGGRSWYAAESATACGLGFEVALLLPLLRALRPRAKPGGGARAGTPS